MQLLGLLCFLLIVFALAWRFGLTVWEPTAWLIALTALICYVLAFFRWMRGIDLFLLAGGVPAAVWLVRRCRAEGGGALRAELKRQFGNLYFLVCAAALAGMLFFLGGEQILEWDGYNLWGPDTKSLWYRDGFAPKYSNPAYEFGDYTPLVQIVWWLFCHLLGSYQERYLFWGYYVFGAVLLFSAAAVFTRGEGKGRLVASVLAPPAALCLPGVACTTWYRALTVDPIMAMLFGTMLCRTVLRPDGDGRFWKIELLTYACALALSKSIGILWGALCALFYLLWWGKERREYGFSGALLAASAVSGGSWIVYCRIMDRHGYLADNFAARALQRFRELRAGTLFAPGSYARSYLGSYVRAFFTEPIHRERTFALDPTPVLLLAGMLLAVFLLRRFGFLPRRKTGRLLAFLLGMLALIYGVVFIGQLTMFYYETQYFEPVKAVTLLMRYASPANIGLLMLLAVFASGRAAGAPLAEAPEGSAEVPRRTLRRAAAGGLAALVLLSCAGYNEIYRRFFYDYLDAQRITFRASFEETYEPFFRAVEGLPLDEENVRVLLCTWDTDMNPIVINRASPVSFASLELPEDPAAAWDAVAAQSRTLHCGYLYVFGCDPSLTELLSARTAAPFRTQALYRVLDGGGDAAEIRFEPVS